MAMIESTRETDLARATTGVARRVASFRAAAAINEPIRSSAPGVDLMAAILHASLSRVIVRFG
jgi:hypothetical protein